MSLWEWHQIQEVSWAVALTQRNLLMRENDTDMEEPTLQPELKSNDHVQTFMVHFFRSETAREMAWRRRLDFTASGAVFATGGLISFSFTTPGTAHFILLLNVFLLLIFLYVEVPRHQEFAKIKHRVRRIEQHYIAPLFNELALEPKPMEHLPYIEHDLLVSLLDDKSPVSWVESVAWRLRNIYMYLFGVTYIVWILIILNGRTSQQPWLAHINQQASIGSVPGTVTFFLFSAVTVAILIFSFYVSRSSGVDDYLV